MDVNPLLELSNGPNYFPSDPEILYEIKVDNDHDARADLIFQFRFNTKTRAPCVFTGFVGAGNGILAPANSPPPVAPGTPVIPPAITTLDGPGPEGLSLRQNYTVTLLKNRRRQDLRGGQVLYAVPSKIGPRTIPGYPAVAQQGIYDLSDGIRVFAGTVGDPVGFLNGRRVFDDVTDIAARVVAVWAEGDHRPPRPAYPQDR